MGFIHRIHFQLKVHVCVCVCFNTLLACKKKRPYYLKLKKKRRSNLTNVVSPPRHVFHPNAYGVYCILTVRNTAHTYSTGPDRSNAEQALHCFDREEFKQLCNRATLRIRSAGEGVRTGPRGGGADRILGL